MQVDLARSLERLGRMDEAYGAFERAAKLRPGDVEALCGMGDILLQRHRPEEARRCFAAALRNRRDSSPAYLGLALVADQLGPADDVLANLQQALRYSPEDAAVLRLLGDTLARRGRIAEAATNYERALQVRPGDAATEARLGYALFLLRRPAEAVRHWEEALRLDPKFPGLRERIEQAQRELMVNGDSHTENWPASAHPRLTPPSAAFSRIYPTNLALARRQERRHVIGVGACLPVRQTQGPELVEGQAILTSESRASSLLQFA